MPVLLLAILPALNADTVQLTNGDLYHGKLISVNASHVRFQSEIQGELQLPRSKVRTIHLQPQFGVVEEAPAPAQPSEAPESVVEELRQQGADSQIVDQIKQQFLGDADPAATKLFHEMLSGVLSGKLSMGDIRSQAADAVDQIDDLQSELGEEAGDLLQGYRQILERFLRETRPAKDSAPEREESSPSKKKSGAPPTREE